MTQVIPTQADRDAAQRAREVGALAGFRAIYGPTADPFHNPEGYAFAETVAEAIALAARSTALEEAASKCLFISGIIGAVHGSSIDSALNEAATAIRALNDTPPQDGQPS